jgi:hypothetical protein
MKFIELSRWSGKWSFRLRIFGLWIGANLRHPAAFIIFNGKQHNWQVQTWSPRLAYWRSETA